jgi:putative endonuclease
MTNKSKTLYTGVTNDIQRRAFEHKNKLIKEFTKRYNITKLVYCESVENIQDAIIREKQIKGWLRTKKVALVEADNPGWKDLSKEWFGLTTRPDGKSEILR